VGGRRRRPARRLCADTEHDLQGALVTPGLIDAHTHLVYGGDRAAEFEQRLQGASYEDIARAGGGIRSTVAATRAASDETLFHSAAKRARSLMAEGVTTLEVKSGYGLTQAHESRCMRGAAPGPRTALDRAHHLAGRTRPAA
jgi:imidazolonepropionase